MGVDEASDIITEMEPPKRRPVPYNLNRKHNPNRNPNLRDILAAVPVKEDIVREWKKIAEKRFPELSRTRIYSIFSNIVVT